MQTKAKLFFASLTIFGLVAFSLFTIRERGDDSILEMMGESTYIMSEHHYNNFLRDEETQLYTQINEKANKCINGKDPATLTKSQQLKEFIEGPCLPVVVVPGLMGSKLKLQIDCEVLKKESPEVFKACGWNSCSGGYWSSSPKEKYTLWISELFGQIGVVKQSSVKCWSGLINSLNVF